MIMLNEAKLGNFLSSYRYNMSYSQLKESLLLVTQSQSLDEASRVKINYVINKTLKDSDELTEWSDISSFILESIKCPDIDSRAFALFIFAYFPNVIIDEYKNDFNVLDLRHNLSFNLIEPNKTIAFLAVKAMVSFMKLNKNDHYIFNTFWPLIIRPLQHFIKFNWIHDDELIKCLTDVHDISNEYLKSLVKEILLDIDLEKRKKQFIETLLEKFEISHETNISSEVSIEVLEECKENKKNETRQDIKRAEISPSENNDNHKDDEIDCGSGETNNRETNSDEEEIKEKIKNKSARKRSVVNYKEPNLSCKMRRDKNNNVYIKIRENKY